MHARTLHGQGLTLRYYRTDTDETRLQRRYDTYLHKVALTRRTLRRSLQHSLLYRRRVCGDGTTTVACDVRANWGQCPVDLSVSHSPPHPPATPQPPLPS